MSDSLHALAAPHALGALDEVERRRFEAHLSTCPSCTTELAGFAATAAALASSQSVHVPTHLRSQVMSSVAVARQDRIFSSGQRRRWRRVLPALAVAAALIVPAAAVTEFVVERNQTGDTRAASASMSSVLAAPDASTRSLAVEGGGTVRLVSSHARRAAVVAADRLPALPKDRTYQVWAVDGVSAISHGTFDTSIVLAASGLAGADHIAVTIEPRGGSTRPSVRSVVTLAL